MRWVISTLKKAEKSLASIPKPERTRIEEAIDQLVKGPYECGLDVKPLRGRSEWRLRIGGRRILFLVDAGKITITVISVGPRGDAYKK